MSSAICFNLDQSKIVSSGRSNRLSIDKTGIDGVCVYKDRTTRTYSIISVYSFLLLKAVQCLKISLIYTLKCHRLDLNSTCLSIDKIGIYGVRVYKDRTTRTCSMISVYSFLPLKLSGTMPEN